MRYLIVILAVVCFLQPMRAQDTGNPRSLYLSTLSSATPPNDSLATTLWRIAVATRTPIGFESIDQSIIGGALGEVPALSDGRTVAQALNAALASDDRYEWRMVGNMAVVRPKSAWADKADPLNRPVTSLQTTGASPIGVLQGIQSLVYTNQFVMNPNFKGTLSLQFETGTVVDVLDRLTQVSGQMMWVATTTPEPEDGKWGLRFELRNTQHVTAVAAARPPVVQASR